MATTTRHPNDDGQAARRNRTSAVRIGLSAILVIFAAGLAACTTQEEKPGQGEAKSIRVTSSNLIKKEGTGEPKAVLGLYEDFLCPACGTFEKNFGPTVNKLIDTGAVAVDYYMVSILDRQGEGYSSRASNAAYCVADGSTDAFRRFHATLYAEQPQEGAGPFADNSRLIEIAEQSGSTGAEVSDCINNGTYTEMAKGLAKATSVTSTPTVRINGREYTPTRTEGLVSEIKEIVGNVPGL